MMFKRSASRTQRSKGFVSAKQILQILVLLGICFWLFYQVKYSHDKKKSILDEKDSEISHIEQDGRKSGRKELVPRVYDKQHNAAAEEDELDKVEDEDEGIKLDEDEHEEIEESSVHDGKKEPDSEEDDVKKANEEVELEEEEEEEAVKNDEPENHEKPREVEIEEEDEGLKELEDQEQEQPREEGEDHEEFIDEEKENEGNGEEVKKDDAIVEDEDEDHDEISREAHEAREEHYKGDDASSAVTRDTEIDAVEAKELDKSSSVHNSESTTVEITEKNPESGNSNGSEDHDHATDETELGNAAAVNSTATSDPELIELSLDHSEDTSLVGSDSNLRLPSNTTESSETN